jgi:diguanylate cyclase (GGDEF)-like protein/PAS domain S-box-containing protein
MSGENEHRLDENQYSIIVESAPNMIWRSGRDTLCNFFNTTWLTYTGRTMSQELGNGWAEGVHPDDFDRCVRIYLENFEKRRPFEMVYRLKRHDGEYRWIHDRGVPYFDNVGEFCGYIGSCLDVHEQITGETWKTMAQKDGLTGVLNRAFFEQEGGKLTIMAARGGKRLCAVMFDIDNFKFFNDHYGHHFGDEVLVAFSGLLMSSIRETDLLGRYGGDEFILLLPETDVAEAETIVGRIEKKTADVLFCFGNDNIGMSFSFGIVRLNDGESYGSLVQRADKAMYEQKRRKKTNYKP